MSVKLAAMVEASYQGMLNLRGTDSILPVFILKDKQGRSIAIPLSRFEAELLQHITNGETNDSIPPQPFGTLLSCLDRLDVKLSAVHIHFSREYDLPTQLILRPRSGPELELDIPAGEGIAYAWLAGVPIYVDEELSPISVHRRQVKKKQFKFSLL
jgi:bifunctional DNase/RNase